MLKRIHFTVTLEGIRHARRLQQRDLVLWGGSGAIALGFLLWWFTGNPGALVVVAIGALIFGEWWFAPFDRWFDRRQVTVGSECEIWLDDVALHWRQSRGGAFQVSGQYDWSQITGVREDHRAFLVMDGRVARVGIPKSAFPSAEAVAEFRAEVLRRGSERRATAGRPQQ
jgi:hypothetical protein